MPPKSMNLNESGKQQTTRSTTTVFEQRNARDQDICPPIEAPQVTVVHQKKHNVHNHLAIILGIVGGATLAFLLMHISVLIYKTKQQYEASHTSRAEMDMRNWGAAKVFSYKEIKVATRNLKKSKEGAVLDLFILEKFQMKNLWLSKFGLTNLN
ncbi:hypothetical protein JHK82_050988 [Glycine max]|nr:hypothetical protein JHK86_050847 [Glycine max]KAG4936770.1 hypothetical protein JHK85_051689 [Glycine max]KAG5092210.1 hypothetical protein JHK82_050988 [Glycine max]KAG5095291.1 hypothetical protein JHK84_050879 [Glycine max]